jgi:23S rRNA pseudouridine2604 synthase
METPKFPMRINKYLALKKHSTRRGADDLIVQKKVFINGELAVLGDKVNETDSVEVRFRSKEEIKQYVYFAYNKPKGVITHSPQKGEKDIKASTKHSALPKDIFPVGRLDKESHGLMILTNDGRITDKLLNPDYAHDKEYVVETREKLRANFKERMEAGVNIEGYNTKKCRVEIINDFSFRITLTEGKKHQIRRMCVALFNEVKDIKRVKVMNVGLGNLAEGQSRQIIGAELEIFLKSLGF